MVACAAGKLQMLKFLLESAVYPTSMQDDDFDSSIDDSDADSGVLDPTGCPVQKPVWRSNGKSDVFNAI